MRNFHYSRPAELKNVVVKLNTPGKVQVIAGGTDLLGTLKDKILPVAPQELVSLKGVGLDYIKEEGNLVKIGAMTTLAELAESATVGRFPVLAEAAQQVASPQIRNMATIGGNICQEPRCWYYRYQDNKFHCMRKGGEFCNALTGNNTYHSIFGAAKVCDTACQRGCPNETQIAAYMNELRKGNVEAAAEILFRVNPIAAATGRVCPHTCQGECSRHLYDQSVSIREVEKYLGDYILEHAEHFYKAPEQETGKHVALIGAGPAGLTAAYKLRSKGISVTIIDSNAEIGGMLYYGIPAYRLPKVILRRFKEVLEAMGIVFKTNTKVGKDVSFEEVRQQYDAVMVGIGAWESQKIGCIGEDAQGVIGGIDFLNQVANEKISAIGKTVLVVGGGNTAMDACRTAKRMGAERVSVIYRRTQAEMPAEQEEIAGAMEEGVEFCYLASPIEIIKNQEGQVSQVILQKMELGEPDKSGRRRPVPIQGETEPVTADTVIAAIGQNVALDGFPELSDLRELTHVFVAGDVASGPKTAVEAIASGRAVAEQIAKSLEVVEKETVAETKPYQELDFGVNCFEHTEAVETPTIQAKDRVVYQDDSLQQNVEEILSEAGRCFNCGCVAVSPSDIAPALIALDAKLLTTERTIPANQFFSVGIESSTVLQKGELVVEIQISKDAASTKQSYRKFRTRKSIDFPIAGLASSIRMKQGRITAAKLVFSGVAPIPYEFTEVEAYLVGKEPTEEVAGEASKLALKATKPLEENLFKLQLVKSFVRRAILDAAK